MDEPLGGISRFFRELKRRNVYKVAVTYVVVAFVGLEAVDLLIPATTLPAWVDEFLVALAVFGFPVALVVAWAFEMTPGGVRRTSAAETPAEGPEPTEEHRSRSRLAVKALVGLGVVAAAVAGGWYLTGGGGETEPAVGERSIAVLPFENMGGEESEQFTRGVHDDLLTRLSNISGLKVISRTSVLPYRETTMSLPQIADSLGVRWIVEGGVQQSGDQVQVNAQLIQADEDAHRWAESYRRELTTENLFAVQSELTKKIARSLEAELSSEEQQRVERHPTESLEAYRLYVQGRTHLDQRTETGMRRAQESFRRAIERDSLYAPAWSGLADARYLLAVYGFGSGDTLRPRALEAARRALKINPDLAEARASIGAIHRARRDGPAAVRELRRAVELKPSYARAHHWLGNLLAVLGRLYEGQSYLRRAGELDPTSPPIHVSLSNSYRLVGRYERALQKARRALELAPGYRSGSYFLGATLLDMGRAEKVIASFRRVLAGTNLNSQLAAATRAWLAVAQHRLGNSDRVRALLARIREGEEFPFMAGVVHAELGERELAIAAIREGHHDGPRTQVLRHHPVLDPLRDDARFQELIREVNRTWGLNPDGSLPDSVDVSFEAGSDG